MKNFVVTSESVKNRDSGLAGYKNYLTMKDHPNHAKATTEIYQLANGGRGQDAIQNILLDTFSYEASEGERRRSDGIRGRYKLDSFAHSYVLSIPKFNEMNVHVRPSPDQWRLILKDVHASIFKTIKEQDKNRYRKWTDNDGAEHKEKLPERYAELTQNDFVRLTFANVHVQAEGNDHMNLLIGKLVGGVNGCVIKELTQKAVLQNIKSTYTASLAKHCGLKAENYKPVQTGRPSKRVKVAQAHAYNLKKHLEELRLDSLFKPFRNLIKNIEKGNTELVEKWKSGVENEIKEIHKDMNEEEQNIFESAFVRMNEKTEINKKLTAQGFEELDTPFETGAKNETYIQEIKRAEAQKQQDPENATIHLDFGLSCS